MKSLHAKTEARFVPLSILILHLVTEEVGAAAGSLVRFPAFPIVVLRVHSSVPSVSLLARAPQKGQGEWRISKHYQLGESTSRHGDPIPTKQGVSPHQSGELNCRPHSRMRLSLGLLPEEAEFLGLQDLPERLSWEIQLQNLWSPPAAVLDLGVSRI